MSDEHALVSHIELIPKYELSEQLSDAKKDRLMLNFKARIIQFS